MRIFVLVLFCLFVLQFAARMYWLACREFPYRSTWTRGEFVVRTVVGLLMAVIAAYLLWGPE